MFPRAVFSRPPRVVKDVCCCHIMSYGFVGAEGLSCAVVLMISVLFCGEGQKFPTVDSIAESGV